VQGRYFRPREGKCFCNLLHIQLCENHFFLKKEEKKCFLVYRTHSNVTTPRFLPACANSVRRATARQ